MVNVCEDSAPDAEIPIQADFQDVNLAGAKLRSATLFGANFSFANLHEVDLCESVLNMAILAAANCCEAHLQGTDFQHSLLIKTNFHKADLYEANLTGALLSGANFHETRLTGAVFGDNDLSKVNGLENARLAGPCTIGIETIYASKGQIPKAFLINCRVPGSFIDYIPSLVGSNDGTGFHSCFISYSHKDEGFVQSLCQRMRKTGLRVQAIIQTSISGGRTFIPCARNIPFVILSRLRGQLRKSFKVGEM